MKKTTILMAGLLLAAGSVNAENARLNLFKGGNKTHAYKVNDISAISYHNPLNGDGMSHIRFNFADGSSELMRLDEIEDMQYAEGLPDNPFTVDLVPHHMCGSLYISSSEQGHYYRVTGMPTSRLEQYDMSLWTDILINKDKEYIQSVADYYQKPLSSWDEKDIFEYEMGQRDWFPDEIISPGTQCAICLYTCKLNGNNVEVTTEPMLLICNCKTQEDVGTRFNIDADITSTKITVKVDPINDEEIQYNVNLFSADEVASSGIDYLVQMSLYRLEQGIYIYGMPASWDEALNRGHSEHTWTNKRSGDKWVAVVYGVEYGVPTTICCTKEFEIPIATPTDDCKFEVTSTQVSPSEMKLNVTPSNQDTRYVAILVESSKIAGTPEEHLPELYAANQVYYLNSTNNIKWNDSKYVGSGARELSTLTDVIDGQFLKVGVDYTVLLFGVDEVGTRTTELVQIPVCTQQTEVRDELSFEVNFHDFNPEGAYFHSIFLNIKPSDLNAKYVVDKLQLSNYYAQLDGLTDEEYMQQYIDVSGKYLEVYSGEFDNEFLMGQGWSGSADSWEDYAFIIFGYDGTVTSPLYYYQVNPLTGEVKQLRGPGSEQ